jgi:hypothetical protein
LYVQALYEANKNHKGVYLEKVELSSKDTWHRREQEEHTLEVYRGAKVREGLAIWVPSEAFIQQLKAAGAITSGSSELSKAWREAKEMVGDAVEAVKYAAGFVVGLLEGAWNAIVDLFQGAADMIEAVAKVVYSLVTGNPGAIKTMLMGWVNKLKAAWAGRDKIADEFMKKWEAKDGWDRGRFQGEVLGWVMMTVLITVLTLGEATAPMVAGKWGTVLKALKTLDALGDVTTYAGKVGRLPGKAYDLVKDKVGKPAKLAEKSAADGARAAERAGTRKLDRGERSPMMESTENASAKVDTPREKAPHELPDKQARMSGRSSPRRNGAWETEATIGEPRTPKSVAHGTVKMEDHPDYQRLIEEATAKGFTVQWSAPARVALVHVIDETGALIEVRREIHLLQGMRFLDLEHEMGHLRQLDRFGTAPPPTLKLVRKQNGAEVEAGGSLQAGTLTTRQNAVVEYHNRLDEYIRLASRDAPGDLLTEHAQGLNHWRKQAETDGLGRGGSIDKWAEQHFNEIPSLERKAREFGAKLDNKTGRWQPK